MDLDTIHGGPGKQSRTELLLNRIETCQYTYTSLFDTRSKISQTNKYYSKHITKRQELCAWKKNTRICISRWSLC